MNLPITIGNKADAAQSFSGGQITGKDRRSIREQKHALLSHRKNLKPKARKGLKERKCCNFTVLPSFRLLTPV